MVNSTADFNRVSTRKKKQENKRVLSQLSESDAEFLIRQTNREAQTENRSNVADGDISLNNANSLTQISGSQVDLYTLYKNIANKVRSEVDSVMTVVETRVQDAVLTAVENLPIPGVELAMKSVYASSERGWIVLYWTLTTGIFQDILKALKWLLQVE